MVVIESHVAFRSTFVQRFDCVYFFFISLSEVMHYPKTDWSEIHCILAPLACQAFNNKI